MNGIVEKLISMDIDFELAGGRIVRQQLIEILCDDSTGRKEAGDNDDFHKSGQQTFNMSVTWMIISFEY